MKCTNFYFSLLWSPADGNAQVKKGTQIVQNLKFVKSSACGTRRFRRPSKFAKLTVFRIPAESNRNPESTKSAESRIGAINPIRPSLFSRSLGGEGGGGGG